MKVVYNVDFGGFSLSPDAVEYIRSKDSKAIKEYDDDGRDIERTNPYLIEYIERFGAESANGRHADLKVVNLPDNCTDYRIDEYDGLETIYYVVDGKIHLK